MQKENLTEKRKEAKGVSIDTKKEIAKIGMTASLAVVVGTSFYLKNKLSKRLHVGAGAALVGFSFWHHLLYQPDKKRTKLPVKEQEDTKPKRLVENKNIALKDMGSFAELKIEEGFDVQDLDDLQTILQELNHPNLLIRMPKIANKKQALWNKFINTIKKSPNLQRCVFYTIGMRKYLKSKPKEWTITGTYKGAKQLFASA